jgi:hypothetical protein
MEFLQYYNFMLKQTERVVALLVCTHCKEVHAFCCRLFQSPASTCHTERRNTMRGTGDSQYPLSAKEKRKRKQRKCGVLLYFFVQWLQRTPAPLETS